MYARVASFEGDPARIDDAITMVRADVDRTVRRRDSKARRC
jgi:hypothetical protein